MIRNKRRPKIVTPSNSSFSNCVQDQLFIQPLRAPLDTFKPVVYLDEQGRRHGRVSDHLLQRQITNDRQRLKKQAIPHVPVSSTLYGIRNPNIAALVRDVPVGSDDDDDERDEEDKVQADNEIQFIEYKKSAKPATSKVSNRGVSTVSGKQSVKFDTTPSVNMARLIDSHLTELGDIDNVDDDESDDTDEDEEEDLESSKHVSNPDSNTIVQTEKSVEIFSETPSTPKINPTNTEDEKTDGLQTNSTLDYNRSSQEIQMPPTVEDVYDDDIEQEKQEPDQSANNLSSPDKQTNEHYQLTSSPLKTATSSRSLTDNEEPNKSRATTTSSNNTFALLRSDNESSPNISDDESDNQEEQATIQIPIKSKRTSSNVIETVATIKEERVTPQPPEQLSQRDAKGEYDVSQVIQLKESFQPIINEAASYGHLDIVRKLIEGGQSVHTQNLLQRTPLHEACVSGNGQLISELLSNGALINQRDSQGMTPLHVAAKHGTLACLRILCKNGCDLNAQDNLGQTAAHYSAMHDHIDVFEYLTNIQHIDLSLCNHASKLPIHYAAKYGSKKILNYFFESNLSVSSIDKHGNLITHEASEYNQLDCIKFIWKKNRNLFNLKNHSGRICLHTAALYGSIDVLHWLLELNAFDINQSDNNGYRMAHFAASRGHGECFSCLIIHGAQLDVYTSDRHESIFDISKRSGKHSHIEQACKGQIRCHCCEEKFANDSYDKTHARNAVEQLIHTQIQRGYNLNVPVNRSFTTLSQRNHPTN